MKRVAIIDGIRTPFCKMGTSFNDLGAQDLGRMVTQELLERLNFDKEQIDEVIFGCVGQPAEAANIARVISLLAGIPITVPAFTVHRNCASGMEAAIQAMMKINLGDANCILAGGAESMSNIPFYLKKPLQDSLSMVQRAKTPIARLQAFLPFFGQYLNPMKALNIGLKLGLTDPVCGLNMGDTAEVLVKEFGISREEQDQFALQSHLRAMAAREILREEIMPVIPGPKYKNAVIDDNGPREGQNIGALTKLRPFFDRQAGSVTAGNSSQITDGAVALLMMSEEKAKNLGLEPLGYLTAYATAGVEPHRMGIGPAHAIPKVLKKAKKTIKDIDVFEINEAFAGQVLACLRALETDAFAQKYGYEGYTGKIDQSILNVNGGAVALGHPVGSTGARMILTTLKHMKRNNLKNGLAALCIGGGQGMAVMLER
jgi:acetyl-CoA acyltransferase